MAFGVGDDGMALIDVRDGIDARKILAMVSGGECDPHINARLEAIEQHNREVT